MKSTGEVMGVGESFGEAFLKSQYGASVKLPRQGNVFVSVRNPEHPQVAEIGVMLHELGFKLFATRGTGKAIEEAGVPVTRVNKVAEGRPHMST